MKTLPIRVAEEVTKKNRLKQVVVIGLDAETGQQYCVTYGIDKEQCRQAAVAGEYWQKLLLPGAGEYAKVIEVLKEYIVNLETRLK